MNRRSIKLEVEPLVVKYARYLSGLQIPEAAKKTGMTAERLQELEQTKSELSIAQVEKLAAVYKIPLSYFLLDKKPGDAIIPDGFRIVYQSKDEQLAPKVMLAIRKARYAQSVLRDLSEEPYKYPFPQVSLNDDPDSAASQARSFLNVTLKQQHGWSSPQEALRHWKQAVEVLGIFVMQHSLKKENVSAFCLADENPYVILLNSFEHENRRIFSLFHELGHIMLRQSGICTPTDLSRNSYSYVRIEKYCNQFAASLLVPRDEFMQQPLVRKLSSMAFQNWQQSDVLALARQFRVSGEVIYRRFVSVSILDERDYESKRNELIKGFEEYKKRAVNKDVKIPQYRKVISANGYAYSSFIVESLHTNRITLASAASFLDTASKHIATIEAHI